MIVSGVFLVAVQIAATVGGAYAYKLSAGVWAGALVSRDVRTAMLGRVRVSAVVLGRTEWSSFCVSTMDSGGVSANSPQPWKRKRNFWYAVTVKSYVCVSRLRAVC